MANFPNGGIHGRRAPSFLGASPPLAPVSDTSPAEIHPRSANAEQERVVRGDVEQMEHDANNSTVCKYKDYQKFSTTHDEFKTKFLENNFGAVCSVCDRLWHENNMKRLPLRAKELFSAEFPDVSFETASVGARCHLALSSPHAHILLWLNDAPEDAINGDQNSAINLIDSLVSVSKENASGHEKLQEHKHTFTCYQKKGNAANQKCRFGAPFMPSRSTVILVPMPADDPRRNTLANLYSSLWKALAENDYRDIHHFFEAHNILSDDFYLDVLRAGIKRPMVFLKRQTTEKWINAFNPFILNVLGANMDFQFIIEHSYAAYVVEYVNKTNRGISNLQRKIIEVMDEHPEFDIVEITLKLSIDLLNAVEMTSQEAA
ncbi:ATP-dependent DNA helicase [Trichonephila clavata]|uniref:ATP-dependent DNA helicase n=1 Tax=Trichonephila clavata TaxID=2740835 RepID=A0A8X6GZK5_TRICU|nr:ATP-dependent DNA helicase [Trichonephila clavata]